MQQCVCLREYSNKELMEFASVATLRVAATNEICTLPPIPRSPNPNPTPAISPRPTSTDPPQTYVTVFRQGEQGSEWFAIYRGSVDVAVTKTGNLLDSEVVCTLMEGFAFGEAAILNNSPRYTAGPVPRVRSRRHAMRR